MCVDLVLLSPSRPVAMRLLSALLLLLLLLLQRDTPVHRLVIGDGRWRQASDAVSNGTADVKRLSMLWTARSSERCSFLGWLGADSFFREVKYNN